MSVLERLSSALDRRDEAPNVALAEEIVAGKDAGAIAELAAAVRSGPARQANDALKVLYEVGARDPALVGGQCPVFIEALKSKNNRQVWGAMTALDAVAEQRAATLVAELPAIIEAADRGSVIAKDHCNSILIKLARAGYGDKAVPLLVERLAHAAPNQFPTYAEDMAPVITPEQKPGFLAVLTQRLGDIVQESKRKRVEKLLAKMNG
ncbi:hypothetical protein SAMN05428969_2417 [Devosia sp. YR412]|uniref:hypothetical protein n=1 Tax=Devosia sp. YR412 TaxID=1881030 RepID=UPI0008AB8F9E|nr:hypothetical protein [Devosia sp. YR412]SEQ25373.1 hypothetical protein SAMN05428969_2417 [Devosia sp. YR412]